MYIMYVNLDELVSKIFFFPWVEQHFGDGLQFPYGNNAGRPWRKIPLKPKQPLRKKKRKRKKKKKTLLPLLCGFFFFF